jgi:hypothetical protein
MTRYGVEDTDFEQMSEVKPSVALAFMAGLFSGVISGSVLGGWIAYLVMRHV